MPTKEELRDGFNLGDWEVLPNEGVIRRGAEEIRPEPQTWRVLNALAMRDGKLVTRDDLVQEVWDGRAVADDPINRAIREVRKCFGDSARNPSYVETLAKRGYRLLRPVELHTPELNDAGPQRKPTAGFRRWHMIAIGIALGIAVTVAVLSLREATPPPVRSIAVLPFENLSGNESDQYIVSGLKIALVQALHGMEGFVVKNGGVSYQLEQDEIASLLGVESILTGTLQRDRGRLRVSYMISKGGQVEFSNTVEGVADDLFPLQQKLARAVRSNLGHEPEPALITGHRPESEAYDSYMRGMFALENRGVPGRLEDAIELFEAAIQHDNEYGPSYLGLATAYALMPDYRAAPVEEMNRLALQTVEAGINADPVIEQAASAVYGFVYHKEKRWQESEQAHKRAVSAAVVDSNSFNWYSRMLSSVGRLDDALLQALRALEIDPRSAVNNSRAAITYTWLGEAEKAGEYFERASDLGARGSTHLLAHAFLLSRQGEIERARGLAQSGMERAGADASWVGPVFDAFGDASKTSAALQVIDKVSGSNKIAPQVEFTARVLFGDIDGAYKLANHLERPGEYFEMDLLFVPELRAFRDDARFGELLERLGIAEYWHLNGCEFRDDRVVCDNA